jgi:hypothetical protein
VVNGNGMTRLHENLPTEYDVPSTSSEKAKAPKVFRTANTPPALPVHHGMKPVS